MTKPEAKTEISNAIFKKMGGLVASHPWMSSAVSAAAAAAREIVDLIDDVPIVHGTTCVKAVHDRDGMLHDEKDDTPFDVDGVKYCGRCHYCL